MPRQSHHSSNWGGSRPRSGKPFGRQDKYSTALLKEAYDSGSHPFQYLMSILKNKKEDKRTRLHAANMLLPYCMPKLAQVDVKMEAEVTELSLEQKVIEIQSRVARIAQQRPDIELPDLSIINGEAQRIE